MYIVGKDSDSLQGINPFLFVFTQWIEFCFGLGVDHSLVFLLCWLGTLDTDFVSL